MTFIFAEADIVSIYASGGGLAILVAALGWFAKIFLPKILSSHEAQLTVKDAMIRDLLVSKDTGISAAQSKYELSLEKLIEANERNLAAVTEHCRQDLTMIVEKLGRGNA